MRWSFQIPNTMAVYSVLPFPAHLPAPFSQKEEGENRLGNHKHRALLEAPGRPPHPRVAAFAAAPLAAEAGHALASENHATKAPHMERTLSAHTLPGLPRAPAAHTPGGALPVVIHAGGIRVVV